MKDDSIFYWEEGHRPEGTEITIRLPGYHKDEIKVSLGKGFVTISAEKKGKKVEKGHGFYKEEAFHHSFKKSISLHEDMKPHDMEISISDESVKLKRKKRRQISQ